MAAKRGAKPIPAPEVVGPVLDEELLTERQQQLAAMNAHTHEVIERFGDGLPWQAEHYEAEIRSDLRRGCEAFLRAGRKLVVARECTTHGEWGGLLQRLGIEPRQAHRMMETARRLANRSRATDLLEAAGSTSKLIELLSLPEDQFAELANDGATGDLEIDDLAGMTRDDLRAAVRRARADLQERDNEISDLKTSRAQARREWVKSEPDAKVMKLRTSARLALDSMLAVLSTNDVSKGLHGAIMALIEDEDAGQQDHGDFLAGLFAEAIGSICALRDNLPVSVPILEPHVPKAGRR